MIASRIAIIILIALTAFAGIWGAYVCFDAELPALGWQFIPIIVAVFLAILLGFAHYTRTGQYRVAGIVLFLVGLLTWFCLLQTWHKDMSSEKLVEMLGVIFWAGLPAGFGLLFIRRPWAKWFAWSLAGVSVATAGMMLPHVWRYGASFSLFYGSSRSADMYDHFLDAGVLCELLLGPACLLLINMGRGDRRYFRFPGLLMALTGYVFAGHLIFVPDTDLKEVDYYVIRLCIITVCTLVVVNIALMYKDGGLVRICKWVAIGMVSVFGMLGGILASLDFYKTETSLVTMEWLPRMAIATAGLTLSLMLCLVLGWVLRRIVPPPPAAVTTYTALALTCPNCQMPGSITLPAGVCGHCLLRFQVSMAEPYCSKCSYPLINLKSDKCPECGTGVNR